MPTPTITSVTPNRGPTGGDVLVEIVGTNFQLPAPVPPASGLTVGPVVPTVRVFFGAAEARRVRVISATRLLVTTPIQDPGSVTVQVRNVGPYGETIGGEFANFSPYTFERPDLVAESDMTRLVRKLVQELKRQVYSETVLTQHVDWDDNPGEALRKVAVAKIPSIFIVGPTLRENAFHRVAFGPTTASIGVGVVEEYRSARTVDLVFTFGAIADSTVQLLNLMAALTDFVRRNTWITLDCDASNPAAGQVRYELDMESDLVPDLAPSESDVRTCSGTFAIVGFDIFGLVGFTGQARDRHPTLVEDVVVEPERRLLE